MVGEKNGAVKGPEEAPRGAELAAIVAWLRAIDAPIDGLWPARAQCARVYTSVAGRIEPILKAAQDRTDRMEAALRAIVGRYPTAAGVYELAMRGLGEEPHQLGTTCAAYKPAPSGRCMACGSGQDKHRG